MQCQERDVRLQEIEAQLQTLREDMDRALVRVFLCVSICMCISLRYTPLIFLHIFVYALRRCIIPSILFFFSSPCPFASSFFFFLLLLFLFFFFFSSSSSSFLLLLFRLPLYLSFAFFFINLYFFLFLFTWHPKTEKEQLVQRCLERDAQATGLQVQMRELKDKLTDSQKALVVCAWANYVCVWCMC